MATRSVAVNPLVLRVKTKEELMKLKQLECLVSDLGQEVMIRYLEYLVHDTQKDVQCQVPKNIDEEPTSATFNSQTDGPLKDMNKPKVEMLGKFSYDKFLSKKNSNKITFEELITAAQRWGANVVGARADDLKAYLLHLSSVSAMAATQRYDPQMHVDYDKAIRKKAEEVGWAAFKANNRTVAKMYYVTENKEKCHDELDRVESDSEHCSLDGIVVDEPLSPGATISSTLETVDLHHDGEDTHASHKNLAVKEELDLKDKNWLSFSTVSTKPSIVQNITEDQGMVQGTEEDNSAHIPQDMEGSEDESMKAMLPTPALLIDDNTNKLETASGESSVVSNQLHSDVPETSIIPKRHICSHCGKGFGSAITLKVHLRRHTVKPPAKRKIHLCSICGKKFKLPSYLKQHMRHHTGERPYPCTICGEKLISTNTLSEHMLRHTGNKEYICSYCGKQFYSSSALTIHTRIHTGEKTHFCPYCGKGFRGSGYMKSHMLVHTQERPYKCSRCDRGFSISCNLKRHMLTHTGEKPYKCPHCSMAFRQHSARKAHIDARHRGQGSTRSNPKNIGDDEKAHTCSDCGKGYMYLFTLKIHMITHTGGKPLTCPDCGKEFSTFGPFRYHMMGHTGEKHECKECGKGFPSSANLDVHAVVHTGEKPYVCSDCGKAFSAPSNLRKHKSVHTGEKPYVCSYCGKAFGQKSTLQLHVMIHTGEKPFVCTECGKGFSRDADLRKHMKVHGQKNKKSMNKDPVTESEESKEEEPEDSTEDEL